MSESCGPAVDPLGNQHATEIDVMVKAFTQQDLTELLTKFFHEHIRKRELKTLTEFR